MKSRFVFLLGLGLLILSLGTAQARVIVRDLSVAIDEGLVSLVKASGTGASSGASVEGYLENLTAREVNINVYMAKPMYLVNRGSGQNMIASQVYHRDGSYRSDGRQSFITLKPGQRIIIVFVAYCADFEKDNPSPHETLDVGVPPQSLIKVMVNITNYAKRYPNTDITAAAQVAVWLAQGESAKKIAGKFQFTVRDEQLAQSFLR